MQQPRAGRTVGLLLLVCLVTAAAACEHVSSREIGAGMGAIAGGLVGGQFGSGSSRVTTTALGAFAGGVVGAEVGGRLDDAASAPPEEAYSREGALEGRSRTETVGWKDPDVGDVGESASTATEGGRVCRDFRQEIDVRGTRTMSYGRACRGADGVWKIEDSRT